MPELPEVETMRRGIEAAQGAIVADILAGTCSRRPISIRPPLPALRRRLVGKQIRLIHRLGKRVVLSFDNDRHLVIEPRMTGLISVGELPTQDHLRLRIVLSSSPIDEILFWDRRGLGVVSLLDEPHLRILREQKLGPDALAITPDRLREQLQRSRRPIKVGLLDQHAIAGIGNLYASEILHHARIHPGTPCYKITRRQWPTIHSMMIQVLSDAIEHEGSTLSDGTYRNTLNNSGDYQNHHLVYDRQGERCLTCQRAKIERIVQAQRSTFFCPQCQSRRKTSSVVA